MATKTPVVKRLHPIAEAAAILSMSIPKLEEHEANGDITFRWSGNKRYIEPSEIDRLIENLPPEKRAS